MVSCCFLQPVFRNTGLCKHTLWVSTVPSKEYVAAMDFLFPQMSTNIGWSLWSQEVTAPAGSSDGVSWNQAGEKRFQGSGKRTPRESLSQGLAIFTRCHARLFLPAGLRVPREAGEELVGAASQTSRNLLPSRTAAFAEPGAQGEAGIASCKFLLQTSASKCQCRLLHTASTVSLHIHRLSFPELKDASGTRHKRRPQKNHGTEQGCTTDERIFGSEWWSNNGGKGEITNCRASIFPTNKTPSQMKLLMHPGKAQAEHRRRTLRRGNEAQSQTRAFIKKMNFLLLYMDAGSLDNKQEQMKSWPAVRKKWARDWTWKSLVPWCSDMKGRDGCNVSLKKRWEGSPLWQLPTLQENWMSRAETWCVLMGEARRRFWEAPREASPYREKKPVWGYGGDRRDAEVITRDLFPKSQVTICNTKWLILGLVTSNKAAEITGLEALTVQKKNRLLCKYI